MAVYTPIRPLGGGITGGVAFCDRPHVESVPATWWVALPFGPVAVCDGCKLSVCPLCGGEVGYDTDAFDDEGGLNCGDCRTDLLEDADRAELAPASDWCDRCGLQAVCPDCVGA